MSRWRVNKERKVVKVVIRSKRTAEIFISGWMERNGSTREKAMQRLKKFGIELSELPDDDIPDEGQDLTKKTGIDGKEA